MDVPQATAVTKRNTRFRKRPAEPAAPARAKAPPPPTRPASRRALSHVGGEVSVTGDEPLGQLLVRALMVTADERSTRRDVHGFHTYPARLHPETASRLIATLTRPRDIVLDPFCGSGTVVVEARRAGRRGIGVDANPLACELTRLKVRGLVDEEGEALLQAAERVAEHATERRKARRGATRRYPPEDVELFEAHVLLELDGLRDGIAHEPSSERRRQLLLVLSSMLGKFSRKPADTTEEQAVRRIGAGYTSKFFVKRTFELVERMTAFTRTLPERAAAVRVIDGDARRLDGVETKSVTLALTSPPYPGVYDYLQHHAVRLRWLGMKSEHFDRSEIGARRQLGKLPFARALGQYETDMGRVLRELGRVLVPGGHAVLIVADSTLSGRAVRADRLIAKLAAAASLRVAARASQERPHFHGASQSAFTDAPRGEHAILLQKPARS